MRPGTILSLLRVHFTLFVYTRQVYTLDIGECVVVVDIGYLVSN